MEKISVKGSVFVDESGRERIFNGVNLVFKGAYDEKTGETDYFAVNWDEDMIRSLSEMGINLVRLGLVWRAIEPQPGKYNEEYLDMMEHYFDLCGKYGIYVYLDMHQDCYHGMPDWATVTDSYKRRKPKLIWAEGYFIDNLESPPPAGVSSLSHPNKHKRSARDNIISNVFFIQHLLIQSRNTSNSHQD